MIIQVGLFFIFLSELGTLFDFRTHHLFFSSRENFFICESIKTNIYFFSPARTPVCVRKSNSVPTSPKRPKNKNKINENNS